MRKTSLIFLGALVGVVATLLLTQPDSLLMGSAARATASDTYQTLNLFGDVFERVRAYYVERPDDSKLVESAIKDRKSTRLNSSHRSLSRMPSSA